MATSCVRNIPFDYLDKSSLFSSYEHEVKMVNEDEEMNDGVHLDECYYEIEKYFKLNILPTDKKESKKLVQKATQYLMIEGQLYQKILF